MKKIKKWKWLLPVLITLMTVILLKSVFLFGYVPTASMEPTLPKGSYIVGLRLYTDLEKGNIIIFRHDGKLLVKRIAAVGGEYVERMVNSCLSRRAAIMFWGIMRGIRWIHDIGTNHLYGKRIL